MPFDFSELRQQRFSGLSFSDGERPLRSMRAETETSAAAACGNAPSAGAMRIGGNHRPCSMSFVIDRSARRE